MSDTSRQCRAEYERPGGREHGDRIVRCGKVLGHRGDHEEADGGATWHRGADHTDPRGVVVDGTLPPYVVWRCPEVACAYRVNRSDPEQLGPVGGSDVRVVVDLALGHYRERHPELGVPHSEPRTGGQGWPDAGIEAYAQRAALPRTSMVAAVSADLAAMPVTPGGVHASLRALASYLAEAIDAHGASANPATTARLAQELRTVLTDLAKRDRSADDEAADWASGLATPQAPSDTSWVKTTEATP